uniref:Placenta-expressed transcript 1 protein n=1 Tax=Marmota marmota marmota TaxID=9994 RepID=A0A8C6EZ38_MARMA
MAVPRSMLLQLGLSLCCALYFSSASPTHYKDNCMVFDTFVTTNNSNITVTPDVFENNTNYTVWVPVNDNDSAVVLQAFDKNSHSVGFWQDADEDCNRSALYHVTSFKHPLLKANWIVSGSEDLTEVELQVFTVNLNRTATLSSLKLGGKGDLTTIPTITKTIAKTTTNTTIKTTTMTTNMTTTMTTSRTTSRTTTLATTKSLAVRALSSPIAGAIHILLVFLTSKLLF